MVDPEIVNEWLQKAEDDYGFACSVIEESPFYAQICFHFHQSAEKYLKALIIAYELEFKRIHDLAVLLKSSMLIDVNSKLSCRPAHFLILSILAPDILFIGGRSIRKRRQLRQGTLLSKSAARFCP